MSVFPNTQLLIPQWYTIVAIDKIATIRFFFVTLEKSNSKRRITLQIISVPTEADSSVDFALEEIISQCGLKEKVLFSELLDVTELSDENKKALKEVGKKLLTNSFSKTLEIQILFDSQSKKYYKSISESK